MRFSAVLRVAVLVLFVSLLSAQRAAAQVDYSWEMSCGGIVKPVKKKLNLPTSDVARVADSIKLCTKNIYSFNGKAGQRLDVQLTGDDRVSMFLLWKNQRSPEHPALFYLKREWQGSLPSSGKYTLTVVTDRKIASYEIEIKVD